MVVDRRVGIPLQDYALPQSGALIIQIQIPAKY